MFKLQDDFGYKLNGLQEDSESRYQLDVYVILIAGVSPVYSTNIICMKGKMLTDNAYAYKVVSFPHFVN